MKYFGTSRLDITMAKFNKAVRNHWQDVIVPVLGMLSLWLGMRQAQTTVDAHHWGLMLSNAIELSDGKIPFTEIFIQYGILTTFIHSIGISLFGRTLIGIGLTTALFYLCSFFLSYILWSKILTKSFAVAACLILFLLHPSIIYPWSNYIAYTFILVGVLMLIKGRDEISRLRYFYLTWAGFSFALAILCRQTSGLFIVLATALTAMFDIYYTRRDGFVEVKKKILIYATVCLGAGFCFSIFLAYLLKLGVFNQWLHYGIPLASAYQQGSYASYWSMLGLLGRGVYINHGNGLWPSSIISALNIVDAPIRFFWFSVVFLADIFFLCLLVFKIRNLNNNNFLLFITAIFSAISFWFAYPIYEVFRLQNGASIGLGLLIYCFCFRFDKDGDWVERRNIVPLALVTVMIGTMINSFIYVKNETNYYPFTSLFRKTYTDVLFLKGADVDAAYPNFYHKIYDVLNAVASLDKANRCEINSVEIVTIDSFISILSPFKRIHVAPWKSDFDKILSPNYITDRDNLIAGRKLLLIFSSKSKPSSEFTLPPDYSLFASIPSPDRPFIREPFLNIAGPTECDPSTFLKSDESLRTN